MFSQRFFNDESCNRAHFVAKESDKQDFETLRKELELIYKISNLKVVQDVAALKAVELSDRLDRMRSSIMPKEKGKKVPKRSFKILHGISTLSITKHLELPNLNHVETCIIDEAKATADLICLARESQIFTVYCDVILYTSYDTHFMAMNQNPELTNEKVVTLLENNLKIIFKDKVKYFYSDAFCKDNQTELLEYDKKCLAYYTENQEFSKLVNQKILNPFIQRYLNVYTDENLFSYARAGAIREIAIAAFLVENKGYTHISHSHDEMREIINAVNSFLDYLSAKENRDRTVKVGSVKLSIKGNSMKKLKNAILNNDQDTLKMGRGKATK